MFLEQCLNPKIKGIEGGKVGRVTQGTALGKCL